MGDSLERQAERLYDVFAELVRGYQFRDREEICCRGISVSQCHALEALEMHGPMTMGELAAHLHLELSTTTRVVDFLVTNGMATREADAKDRRVCRVRVARKGRALVARIRGDLVKEHELVLREIPAESREAVISAMTHLLAAFRERQGRTCAAPGKGARKQRRAG
jgi:DNA-binding MarR family transcriptional regulator